MGLSGGVWRTCAGLRERSVPMGRLLGYIEEEMNSVADTLPESDLSQFATLVLGVGKGMAGRRVSAPWFG
jgi:hypothetical protein